MEKNAINNALVTLVVIFALVAGLALGAVLFPSEKIVVQKEVVTVTEKVAVADNSTNAKLDVLLEDKNFETVAYDLAVADLKSKGYKDLYNALVDANFSIDEKEDISKVVIKDSDVSGVDVKDGDADVKLELKVYFEDLSGDDVKEYVTVDFEVIDGEVEEVTYSF
jgi:hypothetical protein